MAQRPIKQPITPERQPAKPEIGDPNHSINPRPKKDPETHEVPERDPQPASVPKDLPPDPDTPGHDIEVEGP